MEHALPASLAKRWGTAVADRRKALGLSQTALADACGVRQPTISRFETGAATPSDDLKHRIAGALSMPTGDLFAWPEEAAA